MISLKYSRCPIQEDQEDEDEGGASMALSISDSTSSWRNLCINFRASLVVVKWELFSFVLSICIFENVSKAAEATPR